MADNNTKPYEIITGPFEVWVGAVDTTDPEIQATPSSPWVQLGTSGSKNISEDGVMVSHPQALEFIRMVGSTGPRKAVRTEEDFLLSFTLHDMTLAYYSYIMNGNTVNSTAADSDTGGFSYMSMHRGLIVSQLALIIRGASPEGPAWTNQYQVPVAVMTSTPEVVATKGEAQGLLFEFQALEDPDDDDYPFGKLLTQTADATG